MRWPAARTSWRTPTSLLAAATLLTACGSQAAGGGGASDGSQAPATQLQVELRPTAESEAFSASLTCGPPGGTHPQAQEACAALEEHADALEPVAKDVACTQIYGGPETATVTGTLDGRQVDARFGRSNGCEIARWEALAPLLRLRD